MAAIKMNTCAAAGSHTHSSVLIKIVNSPQQFTNFRLCFMAALKSTCECSCRQLKAASFNRLACISPPPLSSLPKTKWAAYNLVQPKKMITTAPHKPGFCRLATNEAPHRVDSSKIVHLVVLLLFMAKMKNQLQIIRWNFSLKNGSGHIKPTGGLPARRGRGTREKGRGEEQACGSKRKTENYKL